MIFSRDIDCILYSGIFLNDFGVRNWAFKEDSILSILSEFEGKGIPVLGGDVLEKINNKIVHRYDNWYCNQLSTENNQDFCKRSISVARQYITTYPSKGDNIFFVIVPQIKS